MIQYYIRVRVTNILGLPVGCRGAVASGIISMMDHCDSAFLIPKTML